MWDSPANAMLNRGKDCGRIDLKTEQGRSRAWELVRAADVVIENFRPGVMANLGFSAQLGSEAAEVGRWLSR